MKSDGIKEAANILIVSKKINSHRQKCTEPQNTPTPVYFPTEAFDCFPMTSYLCLQAR